MMKKITITDILLTVLSLVLCIGIKFFFHACGVKEDGSFMTCHWAEQAVFCASIGMTAAALLRLFLPQKAKAGAALVMSISAVMTALLPGVFIRLCMMETMRCHALMRPAVIIVCGMIAVTGIVDAIRSRKEA